MVPLHIAAVVMPDILTSHDSNVSRSSSSCSNALLSAFPLAVGQIWRTASTSRPLNAAWYLASTRFTSPVVFTMGALSVAFTTSAPDVPTGLAGAGSVAAVVSGVTEAGGLARATGAESPTPRSATEFAGTVAGGGFGNETAGGLDSTADAGMDGAGRVP